MPSTRRSSAASRSPAAGSSSRKKTRNETEEVDIAPAAAVTSPASGSLSRRRTREEAAEVVVAHDVATSSALGKDEEEGDPTIQPNHRRATLRKRSAGGGMSSAAGSLTERPRRKMKKEAEEMASAAEDAEDEGVKVPGDEIKEEVGSSPRGCSRIQGMPRKRLSGMIPSASELSSKSPRSKRKKAGEEIVVPVVDEVAPDEELEVEEDEVGFKEEGDDEEIERGEEVMDSVPKRRVVAMRKITVGEDAECRFIGEPIEEKEAKKRWPKRYQGKAKVKGKNDLIFFVQSN